MLTCGKSVFFIAYSSLDFLSVVLILAKNRRNARYSRYSIDFNVVLIPLPLAMHPSKVNRDLFRVH